MFFSKRRIIALLLLFCIVLSILFLSPKAFTYSFRSVFLDFSKIPLIAINALSHEARALLFFHKSYWQNLRLRHEKEELESNILLQQELAAENERLAKLLDLRLRIPYGTKVARVIGKDFDFLRPYIILDKGKARGVKKYAAVLTHLGLVGKILELGYYSSKVILINDVNLCVPALNMRTREQGLVCGTLDGRCKFRFLDIASDTREGDVVVTSGLNMTYPEGILIGRVRLVGVESSGLGKFAIIEPAVKISSLEEVLIVVP